MSKLLEDPKVQALVDKEVARAIKAERKRVADIVKSLAGEVKDATSEIKNPTPFEVDEAA